jgi:hypothetical protein
MRLVTAAAAVVLLAACGGGGQPVAGSTAPVDPLLTEAFNALPACGPTPAPAPDTDAPGLHLPDEAIVTQIRDNGPLTQVTGYVALTPIEVRLYYEQATDVEVIQVEDEGYESEVLVTDGQHRLFVKAQALCSRGSNFAGVIAPEDAAGGVPTPAGSPPTS